MAKIANVQITIVLAICTIRNINENQSHFVKETTGRTPDDI